MYFSKMVVRVEGMFFKSRFSIRNCILCLLHALGTALCHATCVTLVICCKRSGFIWTRECQHGTRGIFTASRNVSKSKKLGLGYC